MKNERGITLIALILVIIVLMILAGISISLVVNNELNHIEIKPNNMVGEQTPNVIEATEDVGTEANPEETENANVNEVIDIINTTIEEGLNQDAENTVEENANQNTVENVVSESAVTNTEVER